MNCGTSELYLASERGNSAEVQRLIAGGAAIEEIKWKTGCSPLRIAAMNGHDAVVLLLVERGADLSAEDIFAIQLAAMLKIEEKLRAKCEAFAMGQQERLGAESWVQGLDSDVVRMVLEQVPLVFVQSHEHSA